VVEAAGDGQIKEFIGTGPFRLLERVPDRYVRMARFDRYAARSEPANGYGGRKVAYVDELQFIPVPDVSVRIAGVESGEYHFSDWITPDAYNRLLQNPRLDVMIVKPNEWITGVFNKKSMFGNRTLRQAIVSALDMEPIMRAAVGNKEFYRLDPSLMFKEQVWWSEVGKEVYNHPDPAKAKRLMQEAGYKGETIRWMCTQFYEWMYKSALAAKQQLEEVGFKIDLQVMDWASVVSRRSDPKMYEIFTTGIALNSDPTQTVVINCDWPGWTCDPKADAMMARLAAETDFTKRYAIWTEIQKWFWEEVPVIKFGDFFILRIKQKQVAGYANRNRPFFWNAWLASR
jgi:peptide/nickel transport system substrate-binding protein